MRLIQRLATHRLLLLGLVPVAALVAWSILRPAPVVVALAQQREVVQTVVANGRVQSPARIQVGTLTLATVARILVDEGDQVQPGQLLVELEGREAHAAVAQAKAGVAQAQVRLEQVLRVRAPAAQEQLRQAELSLNQAQTEYERQHDLLEKGAASQMQYDQAATTLDLARSRYQAAELQASSAGSAGVDVRLARGALAQAQAALDAANARLAQTLITAPAGGVVAERGVETGDLVQPGKVLLVLAGDGPLRLSVPFDEKNLGLLRVGQRAVASADAYPGQHFEAEIERLAPAIDAQRSTIEARLKLTAPPGYLRPDMSVAVELEVGRKPAALVVPGAAVRDLSGASPWVWTVRDGRLARQEVALGLRGEGLVEVTQGLAPGAAVVVAGQQDLTAGQRVRARAQPEA